MTEEVSPVNQALQARNKQMVLGAVGQFHIVHTPVSNAITNMLKAWTDQPVGSVIFTSTAGTKCHVFGVIFGFSELAMKAPER